LDALSARELLGLIDREIAHLPEVYRLPLVLCDLEERTQPEAARLLGWTLGSFRGRLLRGRERLRARLSRRGIAPAVLTATFMQGSADAASMTANLSRLAVRFSTCPTSTQIPASVAALTREGIRGLMLSKLRFASIILLAASTLVAGVGLLALSTPSPQPAEERAEDKPSATPPSARPQVRRDQAGDPLPAEALSRLGTIRFRHGDSIHSLAFTPDGKTIVAQGYDDLRIWELATGKQIPRVGNKSVGTGTTNDVSPNGRLAVVLFPDQEGYVGLLEVATGRIVQRFSKRQVYSLCFSLDSELAATIGYHSEIDLWELATGRALGTLKGHKDRIFSVTFSADGKMLVSGGEDRTIRFWDVSSGKQQRQITIDNPVDKVALSSDGRILASLSHIKHDARQGFSWWGREAVIRLWDTRTGKELRQLTMKPFEFRPGTMIGFSTFLFSPDGKALVTGGHDGVVRIWDPATGKELRRFPGFAGGPLNFAFHPDGKTLAVVDCGSAIRLIQLDTGTDRIAFQGHRMGVGSVHFRADNRTAITSGWDGLLHFWDVQTGELKRKITGKTDSVLKMLPDARTYLAEGDDKKLHVYELDTGNEIRVIQGWKVRAYQFALSPDGRVLAQVDAEDKKVNLTDSAAGKHLHTLMGFNLPFMGMSFAPDSRSLFVWSADKTVTVWDPATGEKRRHFAAPADVGPGPLPRNANSYPSFMASLSPDGKLLAFGFQGNAPRLDILPVLDATTGKEICRFTTAPDGVSHLAFSPDGKSLAWGGWREGTVYLGEIATGRERHHFVGHTGRIFALAFSADGKMLISGSHDTTALVWDLTNRLTTGPKYSTVLSVEELETHWKTLVAEDAKAAFRAMQILASDPIHSVPYLRTRLHPISPADEKRLQKWIADLDSDQFAVRETATSELGKLGEAALHAMRKALEANPALETRRRLEPLIEKLEREERSPSGERLRIWRALEVMERAGTPEAKEVLTTLANGAPGARQTVESKAALQRLAQR
jgi:WD40 repeat protein